MEQGFGSDPSGSTIDKTRVLDVKPLRCLSPVFPSASEMSSITTPQPSPFVCITPTGPFPSGVTPIFPFLSPDEPVRMGESSQQTPNQVPNQGTFGFGQPISPIPVNSFGNQTANGSSGHVNNVGDSGSGKKKGGPKKPRKVPPENVVEVDVEPLLNQLLMSFKLVDLDQAKKADGDKEVVRRILLVFDLFRRRMTQIDEPRYGAGSGRRPDLKASKMMMLKGMRTNQTKRIGNVPGIEVGDNLQDLPELPPHYHTTKDLPFHLQSTLYKALMMEEPQFHQILKDQKPDVLVFDIMQPWSVRAASSLNIPAIKYCIASAATCCYFGHLKLKPGVEFPFTALYLKDYEQEIKRHIELQVEEGGENIMLLNTSRAIDAKYLDYLSEIGQGNILPTGVVIQDLEDEGDIEETELIKWIGKNKEHSTVYVSFGSECVMTKEEMEEVAYGLEVSNAHFIWVVRIPRGEQVVRLEEVLPQGFLERIGERGRIVEGWVPQAKILKHASIGAFVTHCGWNSTLESMEFGVPIIALPINFCSDQPINARLVVEIGIATEIARDGDGKLHRGYIAETIKEVIFGKEIGENLRKKVNSLRENITLLREEHMDGVAKVIKQLREKKNQSKNA